MLNTNARVRTRSFVRCSLRQAPVRPPRQPELWSVLLAQADIRESMRFRGAASDGVIQTGAIKPIQRQNRGEPVRGATSLPHISSCSPDCLVGYFDPTLGQELLDIPVAEGETQVEPDRALNDVVGKAVAGVTR
jgi:hypothetical protein